jgi:serine/threonine protein kinase
LISSIWSERSLLMQFQSCPSVVNLWGAFHDSECLYLVFECLKGGDLHDLILAGLTKTTDRQWWSTSVAPHYALQLIHAVEFLHENQTIHGGMFSYLIVSILLLWSLKVQCNVAAF